MKLNLIHLENIEDFKQLQEDDKCLILVENNPSIRTFKKFSQINSNDEYFQGLWIHFKESQSCDFTVERYIKGSTLVTDIYLVK